MAVAWLLKTPQNHHKLIKTKIPKKFTNKKVSCRLAVAWRLKTPQNPTKKANAHAIATYTPPTLSLPTHRPRYRYLHTAHAIATYTPPTLSLPTHRPRYRYHHRLRYRYLHTAHAIATIIAYATIS
ncbi:hypothetical protein KVD33_06695 [Helicobacter pylori]|nr:hypothetical protein KVD33_06695 [Helicobacter pylori]